MRYFIALLAAVVLVAFGVILLTGGDKGGPKPIAKTLPDYASTSATVRFTYDGVINGDQEHRAIRITVGRDQRLLEVIQGYSGSVIQSNPDYNTEQAYRVFLNALNNSGFTKQRRTSNKNDMGACPLGNRFIFELLGTPDQDQYTWSSTCSGTGTFGGNRNSVTTLFQRQIVNYSDLTRTVNLQAN